jgi:ActR/RegA family two-component response regulator
MQSLHRILLLGDDADQLANMDRHLAERGFVVRGAQSMATALAFDGELHPDLAICDYEFDGRHISETIEKLHQQNNALRFIILTPQGHTLEVMRSMRNRIAAFLSRPFSLDDLTYYVRSVLNAGDAGQNRREHNRYLFTVETHCVLINPFDNTEGRPIPALMRDVSRSGVSIIVRQLVPVPTMLKLVVQLNDQTRPIAMLAKSISCMLTQISGVYRLGAKFIGLLPRELVEVVLPIGMHPDGKRPDEDIYMGKSFRSAVQDWLSSHQHEELLQSPDKPLADLAAEFCRAESEHELPPGAPASESPAVAPAAGAPSIPSCSKPAETYHPNEPASLQPADTNGKARRNGTNGFHIPPHDPELDTTHD